MVEILKFNSQRVNENQPQLCAVKTRAAMEMVVAGVGAARHPGVGAGRHPGGLVEADQDPVLHHVADSAAAAEVVESVAVCAEATAQEEGADRHLLRRVHPDHHQSREVAPEAHLSRDHDHQPQGQGRQRPSLDHDLGPMRIDLTLIVGLSNCFKKIQTLERENILQNGNKHILYTHTPNLSRNC